MLENTLTSTSTTPENVEDHYTLHFVDDFSEASKIISDHEVANTLRYSVVQVTSKFGKTGKFHKSISLLILFQMCPSLIDVSLPKGQ